MKVGKKYRGSLDKVLVKYVKDQLAAHPDIDPSFIFITHSGIAAEYIHLVKEALKAEKDFAEIHVTTVVRFQATAVQIPLVFYLRQNNF